MRGRQTGVLLRDRRRDRGTRPVSGTLRDERVVNGGDGRAGQIEVGRRRRFVRGDDAKFGQCQRGDGVQWDDGRLRRGHSTGRDDAQPDQGVVGDGINRHDGPLRRGTWSVAMTPSSTSAIVAMVATGTISVSVGRSSSWNDRDVVPPVGAFGDRGDRNSHFFERVVVAPGSVMVRSAEGGAAVDPCALVAVTVHVAVLPASAEVTVCVAESVPTTAPSIFHW